jgi:hypothetical protein
VPHKKAKILGGTMQLINAKWMARRKPERFQRPLKYELDSIEPDDCVKVCAETERFWVQVISVDGDTITGRVDSMVMGLPVEYGDEMSLHKDNVYDIAK